MMDYEIFKAVVKEKFLGYLPPKYRDAAVEIRPVQRVNHTMDSLTVYKSGDAWIFPNIYVDDMYKHYQSCEDLESVLLHWAGQYTKMLGSVKGYEPDLNLEHFKDNVVMCLVNTEQNRELLAGVPNRGFHDLSVIYRWVVSNAPNEAGSVLVTDSVAAIAGMTEEELFQHASQNTRRISPVSIMSLQELICDLLSLPPEMAGTFPQEESPVVDMWVITNANKNNGAVSMLYEENLHQLAEKVGDDLIILPSSIHEVIAIPAGQAEGEVAELAEMVHDVNMGAVDLEERLSNSVYQYDRNTRKVTLAAESPEKRLDSSEMELPLIKEENRAR